MATSLAGRSDGCEDRRGYGGPHDDSLSLTRIEAAERSRTDHGRALRHRRRHDRPARGRRFASVSTITFTLSSSRAPRPSSTAPPTSRAPPSTAATSTCAPPPTAACPCRTWPPTTCSSSSVREPTRAAARASCAPSTRPTSWSTSGRASRPTRPAGSGPASTSPTSRRRTGSPCSPRRPGRSPPTRRPDVGRGGRAAEDARVWHFPDTPPLSTYVVVVNAGPFHEIRQQHDGYDLGLLLPPVAGAAPRARPRRAGRR